MNPEHEIVPNKSTVGEAPEANENLVLDEKEIELLLFTLARGQVRYGEYISHFEKNMGWTHDSIMRRIGSNGTLQRKGSLAKKSVRSSKRPVYFIPPDRELNVRLLAFALQRKTGNKHDLTNPKLSPRQLFHPFPRVPQEMNKILSGMNIELHSDFDLDPNDLLYSCADFAKSILEKRGVSSNSKFTLVIDYSPERKNGSLPTERETLETLIAGGLLGQLCKGAAGFIGLLFAEAFGCVIE